VVRGSPSNGVLAVRSTSADESYCSGFDRFESHTAAGLVPATPNFKAQSSNNRGGRDKPRPRRNAKAVLQEFFPELIRHGGDHPLKSAGENSGNDKEREDSEQSERHRPERSGYFLKGRQATPEQLEKNPGQNCDEKQSNDDLPWRQIPPRHFERMSDLGPRPHPQALNRPQYPGDTLKDHLEQLMN
jgi:hypothetical protein